MKHTPGPWKISGCQLGAKLLIEHDDENTVSPVIGSVYSDGGRLPQTANAHLIAAAPAMYEALNAIVGQQRPNRWGYDAAEIALDDEWRAQARAALAQAEEKK